MTNKKITEDKEIKEFLVDIGIKPDGQYAEELIPILIAWEARLQENIHCVETINKNLQGRLDKAIIRIAGLDGRVKELDKLLQASHTLHERKGE